MERVSKSFSLNSIENLPASNSTINIFVLWTFVYIVIFRDSPIAIKIDSEEFADSLYFMVDNLRVEV